MLSAEEGVASSFAFIADVVIVVVGGVVVVADVVDVVWQAPSPGWQSVGPAHALPFCCGCTATT